MAIGLLSRVSGSRQTSETTPRSSWAISLHFAWETAAGSSSHLLAPAEGDLTATWSSIVRRGWSVEEHGRWWHAPGRNVADRAHLKHGLLKLLSLLAWTDSLANWSRSRPELFNLDRVFFVSTLLQRLLRTGQRDGRLSTFYTLAAQQNCFWAPRPPLNVDTGPTPDFVRISCIHFGVNAIFLLRGDWHNFVVYNWRQTDRQTGSPEKLIFIIQIIPFYCLHTFTENRPYPFCLRWVLRRDQTWKSTQSQYERDTFWSYFQSPLSPNLLTNRPLQYLTLQMFSHLRMDRRGMFPWSLRQVSPRASPPRFFLFHSNKRTSDLPSFCINQKVYDSYY